MTKNTAKVILSAVLCALLVAAASSPANAGLKKRGKALAVGGIALAGLKKSSRKEKKEACPRPTEWLREFTTTKDGVQAIGVVSASEQIQVGPSGCTIIHADDNRSGRSRDLEGVLAKAEIELYQGGKIEIWSNMGPIPEGSCLELSPLKDPEEYDGEFLELRDSTLCFTAYYPSSKSYSQFFGSKDYTYGKEAPIKHDDPEWADQARKMWSLLKAEERHLGGMLAAYEEIMESGQIPAHGENFTYVGSFTKTAFTEVCNLRFDKEYQALAKRMQKEIGFEKCASNQKNIRKLMEWYHPDYKDYSATENWFHFDESSEPAFSIWGASSASYRSSYKREYIEPKPLSDALDHDKVKIRAEIMDMVRYVNMIIAARLEPSVPSYYAAYLSESYSLKKTHMRTVAKSLLGVQSESEVLNNIRAYELTPAILRAYQELLEDPEGYDEVFTYYMENMNFAKPSSEELYAKLYDRKATAELCYQAKKGEVFVYMKRQQLEAALRGFNDAVAALDPQPDKERVQAISANYDENYNSLIDVLRTSDYNSEIREWCVDAANYLSNPMLRKMYQEAGL